MFPTGHGVAPSEPAEGARPAVLGASCVPGAGTQQFYSVSQNGLQQQVGAFTRRARRLVTASQASESKAVSPSLRTLSLVGGGGLGAEPAD